MNITLSKAVYGKLLACQISTKGKEFSGFGFAKMHKSSLFVYDFVLLALGSETYTEINPRSILALMDRPDAKNMKVWHHSHPMGDGVPGRHCWSWMDDTTIRDNPLGGFPAAVKWSASVVLTPGGFVGRIDNHLTGKTKHLSVTPNVGQYYSDAKVIADIEATKAIKPIVPRKIDGRISNLSKRIIKRYGDVFETNDERLITDYLNQFYDPDFNLPSEAIQIVLEDADNIKNEVYLEEVCSTIDTSQFSTVPNTMLFSLEPVGSVRRQR